MFYARGSRIGSVPATEANWYEASRTMRLVLIQRDITGTEHYRVDGLR